jgi:hypothetical protein
MKANTGFGCHQLSAGPRNIGFQACCLRLSGPLLTRNGHLPAAFSRPCGFGHSRLYHRIATIDPRRLPPIERGGLVAAPRDRSQSGQPFSAGRAALFFRC